MLKPFQSNNSIYVGPTPNGYYIDTKNYPTFWMSEQDGIILDAIHQAIKTKDGFTKSELSVFGFYVTGSDLNPDGLPFFLSVWKEDQYMAILFQCFGDNEPEAATGNFWDGTHISLIDISLDRESLCSNYTRFGSIAGEMKKHMNARTGLNKIIPRPKIIS